MIHAVPGSNEGTPCASPLRHRLRYLILVVVVAFAVMTVRLWHLQVVHGDEYYHQTRENVVTTRVLSSVRGKILDRKHHPIADNRPAFNIYGTPGVIDDEVLGRLSTFLGLRAKERERMVERLEKGRQEDPRREILLLGDQSRDRAALVRQERVLLKELTVRDEAVRTYPNGRTLAHIVGYMNRISDTELRARKDKGEGYDLNSLVGRAGLEREWENYLRGKTGFERFVVNAQNQRVEERPEILELIDGPRYVPPVDGHNVVLTIDLALQKGVEAALERHAAGAAAVIEVDSGRILALASTPSFDPNIMTGHLTKKLDAQMRSDPRKPYLDKTLRQHYPPGSTYKFVTAIAALRARLIGPQEPLSCTGVHRVGNRRFRCTGAHGKMDLLHALQHSCNVYFWKLSERVGLDAMSEVAMEFGFGEPTGLGLNGDVPGRIPTRSWLEGRDRFRIGDTLNAATGQGYVEVTVLQLAMAYAALANGGNLYLPQVVDHIESATGELVVRYEPKLRRKIAMSAEQLDLLHKGMWMVVNQVGGTAYSYARSEQVEFSGKTGTAQVRAMKRRSDDENLHGWHEDRDHAWFAGFAPSHKPEIALVVLLEHGGSGGKDAGPVARSIIERYFGKDGEVATGDESL